MKKTAAVLLALAVINLAHAQSPAPTNGVATEIIVDDASPAIFPSSWVGEKTAASAEPLATDLEGISLEIVQRALSRYPASVLDENLKRVYVLGKLSFRGVAAGGTNSKSVVYVVRNPRYKDGETEKNVHAEFSSILLRNHSDLLDKEAWMAVNSEGFEYRKGGVQAIKDGQASLRFDDSLHEEGFLTEYGKASLQEDFNGYAARLLMGDEAAWSAIERFPKVKAKADLTMAFYQKLDPSFTPEFFASLRKGAAQ